MVATQTKLRRGTSAQVAAMTPAEAEPVVNMTNDRIHIGDGLRAGGFPIPNAFDIQQQAFGFSTATGTNDLTVTLDPAPSGYAQPMRLAVKPASTNTGAMRIDVNSLGLKDIYKLSGASLVPLVAGDFIAGNFYDLIYDGIRFIAVNLQSPGLVSVSQGDLNTSTGSVTVGNGLSANVHSFARATLPGGSYGFWPTTNVSASVNNEKIIISVQTCGLGAGVSNANYIAATRYSAGSGNAVNPCTAIQRYINSSPPFDLGDGDVGGFVFMLLDSSGEILGTYAADVPPWAYNGPTDIMCTHKCISTGKKFRKVMKKQSVDDFLNGKSNGYKIEEITHKIKNQDMKIIPHPFGTIEKGQRVVMLDPMDDKVSRLIELHNNGNAAMASEMIQGGYISLDNDKITRCGPKGVHISKFRFRGKK